MTVTGEAEIKRPFSRHDVDGLVKEREQEEEKKKFLRLKRRNERRYVGPTITTTITISITS